MNIIEIKPTHPLWESWDDDDWNGTTCSMWLAKLDPKCEVILHAPSGINEDLLHRIVETFGRLVSKVIVAET
jgi:hypothetical protein